MVFFSVKEAKNSSISALDLLLSFWNLEVKLQIRFVHECSKKIKKKESILVVFLQN